MWHPLNGPSFSFFSFLGEASDFSTQHWCEPTRMPGAQVVVVVAAAAAVDWSMPKTHKRPCKEDSRRIANKSGTLASAQRTRIAFSLRAFAPFFGALSCLLTCRSESTKRPGARTAKNYRSRRGQLRRLCTVLFQSILMTDKLVVKSTMRRILEIFCYRVRDVTR